MRFFDLQQFQKEHKKWLDHNFPNQKPEDGLLGLAEEVGELAHAHLKYTQTIRGIDKAEYYRQAMDAIGDILIYLSSYCNTNNIDLESCIMLAWEEVEQRDWIKYPETGRPPIDA